MFIRFTADYLPKGTLQHRGSTRYIRQGNQSHCTPSRQPAPSRSRR